MSSYSGGGQLDFTGRSNAHPNPMFNFLTGFVPRKLKDMYRWTEYIYFNSPHVFTGLNKLADYTVTDITYSTESDSMRTRAENVFDGSMHIKLQIKRASRARALYGNGYYSIYFPFKRMMPCGSCRTATAIQEVPDYEFDLKSLTFKYDCPACKAKQRTHLDDVKDIKVFDEKRVKLISWDPNDIDTEYNRLSGTSVHYYAMPAQMREAIKKGDRYMLDTTPKKLIEAAKDKMRFRFAPGKLFHLKGDAPDGLDMGVGFPSVISVIKQFYHAEVLRRSNEAIALDHLVPFRVLHPAQTGPNNDPVQMLSFALWAEETKQNMQQWRKDPLHLMYSPVALGVTQMGGQGRTLLTLGEVQEVENNIIMGLGIPPEFVRGGMTVQGSPIALRMLENQLLAQTTDLQDLLQWVVTQTCNYMGWKPVTATIENFKMVDDASQKGMVLNADAVYGILSKRTVANMLDVDLTEENKIRHQEALDARRREQRLESELADLEQSLARQAQQGAGGASGLNYDQQAVIAEADAIAQQLFDTDEGQRRSYISSLQSEDFVMYSVVIQRLEELHLQQTNEAKAML